MRAITLGLLVLASTSSLVVAGARSAPAVTVLRGHAVHARDLAKLSLGRSSHADVESVLGAPDEHGADGSLIYRAEAVRRGGAGAREDVVGMRTTTFRFDGDRLVRICRERS